MPLTATILPEARARAAAWRASRPRPAERPCRRRAAAPRGTASRAGVRLRVKSAIPGILVLRDARLAHPEARHRGELAVVRDPAHDREAWPAVGAVDERVAVPAIARVESSRRQSSQVALSAATGASISSAGALSRITNPSAPVGSSSCAVMPSTTASGGASAASLSSKSATAAGLPSTSMQHTAGVVQHVARKAARVRHAVDVRAEPNALNGAFAPGPAPCARSCPPGRSRAECFTLAPRSAFPNPRGCSVAGRSTCGLTMLRPAHLLSAGRLVQTYEVSVWVLEPCRATCAHVGDAVDGLKARGPATTPGRSSI